MGALQAREMANATEISLEQQLTWHLQGNHYPPVPLSMIQPCIEAIDCYWEDDLDKEIDLPEGVFYRGKTTAPAREIIINHHLDAWCEEEPFEDEVE
jgi:hypothetical protein